MANGHLLQIPEEVAKVWPPNWFKDPFVPDFLRRYAPTITHLRVKIFTICVSAAEKAFYLSLTSLEHLEIDTIDATGWVPNTRDSPFFPPTFRNLKSLKLNQVDAFAETGLIYAWLLLAFCTRSNLPDGDSSKLKFLQFPVTDKAADGLSNFLEKFVEHAQATKRAFPADPLVEYFDFRNCKPGSLHYCQFQYFAVWCYVQGLNLLNVDAAFCESIPEHPQEVENFQSIGMHIVSMKNVWAYFLMNELERLERLVITNTSKCTFGEFWGGGRRPTWKCLEVLDVTIDSEKLKGFGNIAQQPTSALIQFLFATLQRGKLRDLRIRFDKSKKILGNFPCPRAHDIVTTCGNVTKFTLTNWLGTNKAVSKFWSGLPHLEEVVLEECRMLADVAFVGENKEQPTFLKLKKLRKFTLRGLEKMPKITDRIFQLVFCHLKVKQFFLFSTGPIKSVTIKGIGSLLSGEYNDCVEKFPFHGWSLEGVSEEEMSQLKSQFRASHML